MTGPDEAGWYVIGDRGDGGFLASYGTIRVRREGEAAARVRFATHPGLRNIVGGVHGGFLLAVVDQALFIGPEVCGLRALGGATVDVSAQFLAPVVIGPPIEAVVEVLRETGRFLFARGLIEQDGAPRLAFSGTLRRPS